MVNVNNKTFHSYTANYVAFGAMMQLAGYSKYDMDNYIFSYKEVNFLNDVVGAQQWADAGYDGWPNAPTPDSDIPSIHASSPANHPLTFFWDGITGNLSL